MAVTLMISTSRDISNSKKCELERALNLINLESKPHPCKFNTIKEKSSQLYGCGITVFCWNSIIFVSIMCAIQRQYEWKHKFLIIVNALVSLRHDW